METRHILLLVAVSFLVAIFTSYVALNLAGIHAASFVHSGFGEYNSSNLMGSSGLIIGIVFTTVLVLGLALIGLIAKKMMNRKITSANQTLVTSEEKFRLLVDAVKDYAIFMLDPNGLITTWNAGAQRITGYTQDEMLGRHVSAFNTQQDIDNNTTAWELNLARETGHFEGEGKRIRKDGTWYWASVVVAPLYDGEGRLTGYSKVIRDITQFVETDKRMRQLNEDLENRVKIRTEALKEREAQLRAIANALPVFIAQVDRNERILFSNIGFNQWFQQDGGDLIGKTMKEVLGEARYLQSVPFFKRVLTGEVVTYERSSIVSGQAFTHSLTLVPQAAAEHNTDGYIILAADITRYKAVQSELENAKEAADVANSTKSAFLANMSHEIRTPLGAVLGFADLLIDPKVSDAEKASYVAVIRRNGEMLSNIINDILDLSKVEAGKLQLNFSEINLNEVLNDTKALLSLQAKDKAIQLTFEVDDSVPDIIKTDQLRLRQILINIIGNAIKFTARGSVTVTVKTDKTEVVGNRKDSLWFVVKDTGIGISSDQIEKLFAPFSQADVTSKRKYGGTGLGLALSKRLAMLLGGDLVLAHSSPDAGSTFVVSIDPGPAQLNYREAGRMPSMETADSLEGIKILLAEDSPDNQLLTSRFLRLAGAAVEIVSNGKEAIAKLEDRKYDVVLMDLQMPVMDGYEATSTLRKQGFKGKILALTAHASNEERDHCLRNGFDGHIKKPIDRNILIDQVNYFSKQSEVL